MPPQGDADRRALAAKDIQKNIRGVNARKTDEASKVKAATQLALQQPSAVPPDQAQWEAPAAGRSRVHVCSTEPPFTSKSAETLRSQLMQLQEPQRVQQIYDRGELPAVPITRGGRASLHATTHP